jgi:hypothetical protein
MPNSKTKPRTNPRRVRCPLNEEHIYSPREAVRVWCRRRSRHELRCPTCYHDERAAYWAKFTPEREDVLRASATWDVWDWSWVSRKERLALKRAFCRLMDWSIKP